MTTPRNAIYGWVPDLPDQRDHLFSAAPTTTPLPAKVDLRGQCPPAIYDQGALGSCTANAIGTGFEYTLIKHGLEIFTPSRLFVYYNERVILGTVDSDSGAMIRDGIKSVAKQGVCPEPDWPYDIARFTERPPASCYETALDHRVTAYKRVPQTLRQLKSCLAQGYPIVFGFAVYESFESPEVSGTGTVPMPDVDSEQMLGGHAVLCVGYDDETMRFLVRNSWGERWGDRGYFTMPYPYLTDSTLSRDFWMMTRTT
ncbi:C1 family peptidase [Longispora sp. NPDC051575]|uniref:C1 family peptidase n=1 Tax=Longispora sp. NPDC051575 TaxID=3154943 RepID=UPI00341EC76D